MKLKLLLKILMIVALFTGLVLVTSGGQDGRGGHNDRDDQKGHDEQDEQGDETVIQLSKAEMKEFEIELATAGPGKLQIQISLPGEIVANPDRVAHIVPRVPGYVLDVTKTVGDIVKKGDLLAVLDSRDLANAKTEYLATLKRLSLSQFVADREEKLWKKKVTSEQEYLDAKIALAEIQIRLDSSKMKLFTLGLSKESVESLSQKPDEKLTHSLLRAPFSGIIIERHITLGEFMRVIPLPMVAMVLADYSTVWVQLEVYQKDLPRIREGQAVTVVTGNDVSDVEGTISFLSPVINEDTRTATARIVLANPDGLWRPGLFVTGRVVVDKQDVAILIDRSAIQTIGDQTCVFVKTGEGFEPIPVKVGKNNGFQIEILSGLSLGDRYVKKGAFTLKAELAKGSFGKGHNH